MGTNPNIKCSLNDIRIYIGQFKIFIILKALTVLSALMEYGTASVQHRECMRMTLVVVACASRSTHAIYITQLEFHTSIYKRFSEAFILDFTSLPW